MNHTLRLMLVYVALASLWLAALVGFLMTKPSEQTHDGLLQTFGSKDDLAKFLGKDRGTDSSLLVPEYSGGYLEETLSTGGGIPHSETNVQTEGVDEADVVKTDGEHIYTVTSSTLRIVKATPPEQMEVVATLDAKDVLELNYSRYGYLTGLFVHQDKLVVLGNVHAQYAYYWDDVLYSDAVYRYDFDYEPPMAVIVVYDFGGGRNLEREFSVGISGSMMTARMIGDVVYLLAQNSVLYLEEDSIMPQIMEGGSTKDVDLSTVKYDPQTKLPDSFVNILALDLSDGDHGSLSIVAGWSSTVYMSLESLYFAVQKWDGSFSDVVGIAAPEDTDSAKTTIYKIATDGLDMTDVARGDVRGWLLNQFSMDEHEGNLRVATTTGWADVENAVYVLDNDLQPLGKLEGLAPTEWIFSARFVGETLYLVTFRQVDPLFVIDLSDPANPVVAGELKIPGFSTYLHPVDDSHVLGIGQENGVIKVSLFNVSDPTDPVEQSKLLVEGLTGSSALYNHKAVLFDRERGLLVLPGYESGASWSGWNYTYYCKPVAYVLSVSLTDGISLRGVISHDVSGDVWYGEMTRSLYIGNHLYTLSNLALQANLIDDLSFAGKVMIDEYWGYGYYSL